MATTRISAYLPPNIDPTKAPLAYGDRAIPKLVKLSLSVTSLTYLQSPVEMSLFFIQ